MVLGWLAVLAITIASLWLALHDIIPSNRLN
jgi:hypothetical protein